MKFESYLNDTHKSNNKHKNAMKFHDNAVDHDDDNKMSQSNDPMTNFHDFSPWSIL